MRRTRVGASLWSVGLVAVMALTACSSNNSNSGGGGGSGGSSGGTAASAASAGSTSTSSGAKSASGTPIVLGMINQENTPAGSFPEMRQALQASISYINNELGGVHGRPLQLKPCATDASVASSATCARQVVEFKPIAVAAGVDFGARGSIPVLEAAKLPYVGGEPILPPELASPTAWSFVGGSVGAFPAQAYYIAKVLKAKSVGILTTDNPAGQAAATAYGKDVLTKLGVPNVKIVSAAADAADFTAPVSQIAASHPDVVMVLFAAQGCSRIMQAKQSLGLTSQFFYAGSCADAGVLKAGGAGAEGSYFNSELLGYSSDNADVRAYRTAMAKYQPTAAISGFSQVGFATGMNLYALLNKLPADKLDAASLTAALAATANQPNFMGHSYTCDRKAVPGAPAVCQSFERILKYTNGTFVDQGQWVNGGPYVKP